MKKYTLAGPVKMTEVCTRRNDAPFNQSGVYIISYCEDLPIYVGEGKLIWERIQGHMSSLVFGNFSLWNYDDNHGLSGFVREVKSDVERSRIGLYEPGVTPLSEFSFERAIRAMRSLFVYAVQIPSHKKGDRKDLEANLIQLLAGHKNGVGGRYLLANAQRPKVREQSLRRVSWDSWPLLAQVIDN